jgi:hypothetical protein
LLLLLLATVLTVGAWLLLVATARLLFGTSLVLQAKPKQQHCYQSESWWLASHHGMASQSIVTHSLLCMQCLIGTVSGQLAQRQRLAQVLTCPMGPTAYLRLLFFAAAAAAEGLLTGLPSAGIPSSAEK